MGSDLSDRPKAIAPFLLIVIEYKHNRHKCQFRAMLATYHPASIPCEVAGRFYFFCKHFRIAGRRGSKKLDIGKESLAVMPVHTMPEQRNLLFSIFWKRIEI